MYYANIIAKGDTRYLNQPVVCALFNNVNSCKRAITHSLTAKPRDIEEVVIYRRRRNGNHDVHGYYEWTGDKLKLKRGDIPFNLRVERV